MSFMESNIVASCKTERFLKSFKLLLTVDLYLCMRERRIMPPLCDWQIINQVFGIYYYIEPELQNMNLIAFKKPNVP